MFNPGGNTERGKMRNLNGFILACVFAILSGTAHAQIQIVIDNQTIPTEDIQSIVILPNSNLISVATNVAYTIEASGTAPPPPPPGTVAITDFSSSLLTLVEGQSTTLGWTTTNAISCTPSGGTGGWNTQTAGVPNGSTNIVVANAGAYTFTLTCQDASGGSAQRSVVITATSEVVTPTTPSCSTGVLAGNSTTWKNFWLVDFPSPKYDNRYATVPIRGYMAIKFNTGSVVDNGKISSVETTVTDGVRLGTISQCAGDFDVEVPCRYVWGIGGGLTWATDGKAGACQLEPNTDYYFNLTFTDGKSGSTTSCNKSPCITTLQATNF